MPVIGRRDDHRVDVGARQHLAIVACREEMMAPRFPGQGEPALIDVRDGDELFAAVCTKPCPPDELLKIVGEFAPLTQGG